MRKHNNERRTIEILALIIHSHDGCSMSELCSNFRREEVTIRRDIAKLRESGFPIYSRKKRFQLIGEIAADKWKSALAAYIAAAGPTIGYPKNISFAVTKLGPRCLEYFIQLVHAIENHHRLEVRYRKVYEQEEVLRTIEPYRLIPTPRDWRLIAKSDGVMKQFLVENLVSVKPLKQKFIPDKDFDVRRSFDHSFMLWQGNDRIAVEIAFSNNVAPMIADTIWTDDQLISHCGDGSIVFRATVNSIEEIADWILSWGGDAKVLQPAELQAYVLHKARMIIDRYR